ncbi:hypothetical protein, partial [Shewanella algae]
DIHLKNSLCQINSDNLFHGTPLHIAVGLHLQHGSLKSLWGGVHFIRSYFCYILLNPCGARVSGYALLKPSSSGLVF